MGGRVPDDLRRSTNWRLYLCVHEWLRLTLQIRYDHVARSLATRRRIHVRRNVSPRRLGAETLERRGMPGSARNRHHVARPRVPDHQITEAVPNLPPNELPCAIVARKLLRKAQEAKPITRGGRNPVKTLCLIVVVETSLRAKNEAGVRGGMYFLEYSIREVK